MITEDTRFLIVGLGLIGGSYARGLSKKGFWVDAIDTDAASISYALENGLIRRGAARPDPALTRSADIVVFALYPTVMIGWLRQNQALFRPGTLLTDVSGVKCHVVDVIQGFLREDLEFIGSHPMAGKEVYGVRNSDEAIFRAANFIVTPTEKNTPEAVQTAREIGRLLEFRTVSELSPAAHDEIIGFVSQLTHAIAVSLMTCNEDENLQNYTGDSFRDLTRIARINEKMWSELFLLNRQELIEQIDSFTGELLRMRGMLEREDRPALEEMFIHSTRRRALFDR
ncbi:prephenate dehydrogenase [Anaerofilum sp. BX8]|uniref:Prephenate dehydrogenase n=1 Tax=Anaerofilum hominis TaxID=2763016 RepID=A0A923I8X0_9FIRM|nr:prephenate dehydrogenase [Anaerofilum hominis]MBC5580423.1 prephenate dehydrogenase [Anaerofilum hominis]